MTDFLIFFETMPTWMKAVWIFLVLGIFWAVEGYYTFSNSNYSRGRHAKTNLGFLAMVMVINAGFGLATAGVFSWLNASQFGLLNWLELPVAVELMLAILVLDLIAQYGVHYLLHKVPMFWRLHLVHHSDKNVDVTTGTRHHPLDFLLRESFALVAVIIMGMPVAFYFFYRILSVLFTYFTHANISLVPALDRGLSWLIVTPKMHRFHHHHQRPWTDSNFGNMFSIWDRLFGTLVYSDEAQIQFGVDIADHLDDESLLTQLKIPWNSGVERKD